MPVREQERLSHSHAATFQDHTRPHDIFTRRRPQEPVAWCPEPWAGPGFWSITRCDDIQQISRRPDVFSSDGRHGGITLPTQEMIRNRRNLSAFVLLVVAGNETTRNSISGGTLALNSIKTMPVRYAA